MPRRAGAGQPDRAVSPPVARGFGKKLRDRLRYELTWGGRDLWLARAAAESGQPIPTLEPPALGAGDLAYWDAFNALSGSRPFGPLGGAGPIPFSELAVWLRFEGIDDADEREEYLMLIRAMDDEYLKHVNKPPTKADNPHG
ncbi:MAG: phage tail assembly chaperone [Pseudomonadota bacterium]